MLTITRTQEALEAAGFEVETDINHEHRTTAQVEAGKIERQADRVDALAAKADRESWPRIFTRSPFLTVLLSKLVAVPLSIRAARTASQYAIWSRFSARFGARWSARACFWASVASM